MSVSLERTEGNHFPLERLHVYDRALFLPLEFVGNNTMLDVMREQEISSVELQSYRDGISKALEQMRGQSILVIGDVGLDEYVLGGVRRISPEAPVPVVDVTEQQSRLGLAANVAQNISSLGGEPLLLGVVGNDGSADTLRGLLLEKGVSPEHLIVDSHRPTTRKMRVMVEHHHIVRVDFEQKKYLPEAIESKLLQNVENLLQRARGVILEDYAKGVFSERGIRKIIEMCHREGKKVLVDPNTSTPRHFYRGATLMTPNRDEAFHLSGLSFDGLQVPKDALIQVGQKLKSDLELEKLIITRGKEGLSLFVGDGVRRMPTFARQVFDVTGAGDTVIAALALAWLSGVELEQACVLANYAAGVVVGKVGCVPCHTQELLDYVGEMS